MKPKEFWIDPKDISGDRHAEYHEGWLFSEHREGYLHFVQTDTGPDYKEIAESLFAVLDKFNKNFSPGDGWFPEMREALEAARLKVKK